MIRPAPDPHQTLKRLADTRPEPLVLGDPFTGAETSDDQIVEIFTLRTKLPSKDWRTNWMMVPPFLCLATRVEDFMASWTAHQTAEQAERDAPRYSGKWPPP